MKLNDIKSIKLVPGWAQAECIVDSVLIVFDEYIRKIDERMNSLPFNASVQSVLAMTDDEMNAFADELKLLSYNRSFERSFREQIVYNTSSAYRNYGTREGVEKIVVNSSQVHDVYVFIGERPEENRWEIYVNSSDPIGIGSSEIYNHNAIYSSRISQEFNGIKYTAFTDERNAIGLGASSGTYVLCEIDIPVPDYGYLTGDGRDIKTGNIPKGKFTGGIVVKYDSNLKEVKADKGNFTGGIIVKFDSNLVQTNIPMGYM